MIQIESVGGDQSRRNQSDNYDYGVTEQMPPMPSMEDFQARSFNMPKRSYDYGVTIKKNDVDMQELVEALKRLSSPGPQMPEATSLWGINQGPSFNF